MMRGRNVCKYSVIQCNEIWMVNRESRIVRNSKYRMTTAYSVDINPTRKMIYQGTIGLVMVYMIATSSIAQSWNIVGSVQVGQITSSFWGKDGPAEVQGSPSLYTVDGGIGGARGSTTLEGFTKSGVGINNWNNII